METIKTLATDIRVGDRFVVGGEIARVTHVTLLCGTDIVVTYLYPARRILGEKQIVLAKYNSLNKIV